MKMHNDPHSCTELTELLQSGWRGETPIGAVALSVVMAVPAFRQTMRRWR